MLPLKISVGVPCATYTVTVTDANNCTMTRSVTIDPFTAAISCNIIPTNVSACGGSGEATVSGVTGGLAPFTYLWNTNPPQTSATATGLQAGSYFVVITDANGCTAVETVNIETDEAIAATANLQGASCWGGNDGIFDVIVLRVKVLSPTCGTMAQPLPAEMIWERCSYRYYY